MSSQDGQSFKLGLLQDSSSTRRFSIRPKRTSISRTNSSSGPSTTSSDLSAVSSRTSVSGKSSSFSTFSSRFKRDKKLVSKENIPSQYRSQDADKDSSNTAFVHLPAEILAEIYTYLSTTDILNLRLVSSTSLAELKYNNPFPSHCGSTLHYPTFSPTCTCLYTRLYPGHLASPNRDRAFLIYLRRSHVAARQLKVLLTYIQTRVYVLKLNTQLQCPSFAPYREGLAERLLPYIQMIQHYLATIRHLAIYVHPSHKSSSTTNSKSNGKLPQITVHLDQCSKCTNTIKSALKLYKSISSDALLFLNHTLHLLIQHHRAATRSPTNISALERKMRGWGAEPPTEREHVIFICLGGLEYLSRLDAMRETYSRRLGRLRSFAGAAQDAARVNDLAFGYDSAPDPVQSRDGAQTKSMRLDKQAQLEAQGPSHVREEVAVMHALDVPLDQLTNSTLASLPGVNEICGYDSLLGKMILEQHPTLGPGELAAPLAWLQSLLIDSFRPYDGWTASYGQGEVVHGGVEENADEERDEQSMDVYEAILS